MKMNIKFDSETTRNRNTLPGTLERIKEMQEKGVRPCEICSIAFSPDRCGGTGCLPWYLWFTGEWRKIRKAARQMGMDIPMTDAERKAEEDG